MGAYDEVEIEDMTWNEELQAYTYSCPCGDVFQITLEELRQGEEIARCPSCSLYIMVIYDPDDFQGDSPPKPGAPAPKVVVEDAAAHHPPAAAPATTAPEIAVQ
uniref:Diphthamide biosynthesis protein 3 n=1 Tax=Chlamydomonas leiostraca TaxID=1034604 RepID=A0A7S0S3Q5_9CHLO|mmetsp:Transcript_7472/g.18524  ORF Transcript_7472/g.18524 Transcript_7472/m.18524 type:complete len:104 (+) Transcript_7472:99-410(+)|eukprot:CAMPEP_0202859908 /NCGR_PEP_ID=MMETSP1391-20130828/1833_1 /ASSEMBLY_ACC=CAM_ASM_000867 /TAXON_ID=1034604 /ORGANISM="Chlamydomonas leiostraca, Strain SAG 11-49" /LENGTH=103 /DNA_ID=CAMNT_0049539011 /DNA_START=108 /DNA_END=419 /DNA_ORIENTATION=-